MKQFIIFGTLGCFAALLPLAAIAETRVAVTLDRGADIGQSFGSLFEATSDDGSLTIGAGFPNAYNTRYRADRHSAEFFIRPADGARQWTTDKLPRPSRDLCGAYLYGRDGIVYSTYGGTKAWDSDAEDWREAAAPSGGTRATMRLGNGILEFGSSNVKYNGATILEPPDVGNYELFFYANGHLCFYHVNRGDGPYRPYQNDEDGFSKLYACPWRWEQGKVDLSRAIVLRLPVVGETTFAWGQLGDQIVTGSNIGGFYVFDNGAWHMLLEPSQQYSYQLYSSISFHDRILMGQYPTGRLFEYDGKRIADIEGWPPVLAGVSSQAREAQTTVLYGGELLVGVWPWGELWRYNSDSRGWSFMRRMFDHPAISEDIVHPYDVENQGNAVGNLWGQRVTSLIPNGADLFVATSAKSPFQWDAEAFPFLTPDKWQSYGSVYRITMPGHLSAPAKWTKGTTTMEFIMDGKVMAIEQDGKRLASVELTGELASQAVAMGELKAVQWGDGVYGRFGGVAIEGKVIRQ